MTYIFIDESGDLGFSTKSSNWFILTIVLTNNHRKIEKCIKQIHGELRKKYKRVKELHAYHSDKVTRKRVLRLISKIDDLHIYCIILDKNKDYTDLKKQKGYLYNYTANILLDRIHNKNIFDEGSIRIYIDQRETNKFLKNNFENYLNQNLSKWDKNFEINIKPSHTEKCLQAVDFISWSIFRKYEYNDYEYYRIIEDKIEDEKPLF